MAKSKKSLAETHPELVKEWHPTKNESITPHDVTPGSGKKVWWKCLQGDDHEWQSRIYGRAGQGRGCPYCSFRKVSPLNSLSAQLPEIAKQWHPTKNGNLKPEMVSKSSSKRVWWKCPEADDHVWDASVNSRFAGSGCPYCSGRRLAKSNSLAVKFPDLAKEWHSTKNQSLTPYDVTTGLTKSVWWKCPKGDDHEWQSRIHGRTNGAGCPICQGTKIVKSNSIALTHPEIASEWHPTRNIKITPYQVGKGSSKKIWWKCPKGDDHEWESTVHGRYNGNGCPICRGLKVVKSNSIEHLRPDIAKEWHPTKNGKLRPSQVSEFSGRRVWWKCKVVSEHEWITNIASRSNGTGCPYCSLTPQSKQELIITFELRTLLKGINPKGFKTRLDGRLRAIDIFIPKLNLCLEFDGAYWHKDRREIDKIKSNLLLKEGYRVIRVREEPLKKINDTDVISEQPYDGKQVTNDILSMILSMYDLNPELVQRIKDYQSKGELQNEKGLNRYIDKILKEKADKKLHD